MAEVALSVVLMAYNEAESIEAVAKELLAELHQHGITYELLIVDDGSKDGTGEKADELAAQEETVRVVHHPLNQGLGGVYRSGFSQSRGRLLTFYPADGQFAASIIGLMLPLMSDYDMVLGYSPKRLGGLLARLLSWGERLIYRLLFGSFPRFQGVLMFKRSLLADIQLKSQGRGWAILMELIVRAQRRGVKMISIPTGEIRPRRSGHSKVRNLRVIWANLSEALRLRSLL